MKVPVALHPRQHEELLTLDIFSGAFAVMLYA